MTKPSAKRVDEFPVTWTYQSYGSQRVIPEEFSPDTFEGSIPEIIARLQEMQAKYPGLDLKLRHETYHEMYDERETHRWRVYVRREETDEELAVRLAKDAQYQQEREARERAEFERLREKFDKG